MPFPATTMAHYQTLAPRDSHELLSRDGLSPSPGPAPSDTLNIQYDENELSGLAHNDPLNGSETMFNPYKDFYNEENINMVSARP